MTAICLETWTWGAASPAPLYSRIVSAMSSISLCGRILPCPSTYSAPSPSRPPHPALSPSRGRGFPTPFLSHGEGRGEGRSSPLQPVAVRFVGLQIAQQRIHVRRRIPEVEKLGLDETEIDAALDLRPERLVKAIEVQHGDRLAMVGELLERHDFQDLFERSESSRQPDEGVASLVHDGFAIPEAVGDDDFRHRRIPHPQLDQRPGNHPRDVAARCQHGLGKHAHEPYAASAVDEPPAALGELLAELPRGGEVLRIDRITRAAEDGDRRDHPLRLQSRPAAPAASTSHTVSSFKRQRASRLAAATTAVNGDVMAPRARGMVAARIAPTTAAFTP